MKHVLLFVMILSAGLWAQEQYRDTNILFCVKRGARQLEMRKENGQQVSNYPLINRLMREHGIVSISKWLPGADDRDVVGDVTLANIYSARFDEPADQAKLQKVISDFRLISDVHSAAPEAVNRLQSTFDARTPSDPYFSRQWYIQKIMADQAWGLWGEAVPGDSTVLIGIVDSGVDYTHPDLADAMFINLGEDANGDGIIDQNDENGIDDDGNEYVDDFMGWDFSTAQGENPGNNDIRPPQAGPYQELSHGTHVSGISAAVTDNNEGIAGISYRSKIIATKHARDDNLTDVSLVKGYSGILYCAKMGARIINCSWGGGYDFYGKLVIDNVTDNYGAIVVCAAGNDSEQNNTARHYPSDFEKCISVAALNNADKKAYYSNYGDLIDISAPGGEGSSYTNAIYSTIHADAGAYTAWQGTSMASPVVAGALALMQAWFPEYDRAQLTDLLMASADDVDGVNISYAGKLGAGRVNVFNAIARSIFPSVLLKDFSYEIIDGNGDAYINPGERVKINLMLENEADWLDAGQVTVTASSSSPYTVFSDSTVFIPAVLSGQMAESGEDAVIVDISPEATYEPIMLLMSITANDTSEHPYNTSALIELPLSLFQTGFPLSGMSVESPLAASTFNDEKSIITIANSDDLFRINSDGSVAAGFPVEVGATTMAPIVADMDADGSMEIVVVNRAGMVQTFNADGQLLRQFDVAEPFYGDAAVANMDQDSHLEIVLGTMRGNLHVIKTDSSELTGFPLKVSGLVDKGPALADFNGDALPEIVFGTFDAQLHVISTITDSLPGFPVQLDTRLRFAPVVSQHGDSLRIFVTTTGDGFFIINSNAEVLSSQTLVSSASTQLSLNDLDQDGKADCVFGSDDYLLHCVNESGSELSGFPFSLSGRLESSPVFADFDDDGSPEMILCTNNKQITIITAGGETYPNFPLTLGEVAQSTAVISDLDADGDLEIVTGGSTGINAIDIPGETTGQAYWITYLGSNLRTGLYSTVATGIGRNENAPGAIGSFRLLANYPNPFNPETQIPFSIPVAISGQPVTLEVFSINGEKVRTLVKGVLPAGTHRIRWNGRNEHNRPVSSGIYIYSLRAGNMIQSRRMLLLR